MSFHLGRPILVLIVLSAACGMAVLSRAPERSADLTLWVFAESHAEIYRQPSAAGPSLIEQFRRDTGRSVEVELLNTRVLDMRLVSLFSFDSADAPVPDLVEIEIGSVGKYFLPPVQDVGLLPLNDFLKESGWDRKILPNRLAPWTKQGRIFGIPHDVHPTAIAYRKDLFDAVGIDLASAKTWPQFQDQCVLFQQRWARRGVPNRTALELNVGAADSLQQLLMQRRLDLLDDDNRVHMADVKVAATVAFYAQMVAGPRRIGAQATPGGDNWGRDVDAGEICAIFAPDWRLDLLRQYAPKSAGKMAVMAMPRFDPTDAPTCSWGGTMIGIPRRCRDPARSWELLQFLQLSPEGLAARRRSSQILPPVMSAWSDPIYHQPDPYFGGQKALELYVTLAGEIPPRHVTPYTGVAAAQLTAVLNRAIAYVNRAGTDGLQEACQRWLRREADDLQQRIDFGTRAQ